MNWTKRKPKPNRECIILTASQNAHGEWWCDLYMIEKVEVDGLRWRWGIHFGDGTLWGDYADLEAQWYCVMEFPKSQTK